MQRSKNPRRGQSTLIQRLNRSTALGAAIAAVGGTVGGAGQALAATYVYTPTPTTTDVWSAGTNWSAIPTGAADTVLTFGDNATTFADGFVNTNTNDIPGLFNLNILNLNGAGPATGAATINLNNVGPSTGLNLVVNGSTSPVVNLAALGSTLSYNINQPLTLTNNTTFQGNGTANFNFLGGLTAAAAGVTTTKTGSSTLTLGGTSTLGSLAINNTVAASNISLANGLPASVVKVASGGSLSIGSGATNSLQVGTTTSGNQGLGRLDASAAANFTVDVGFVGVGTTANSGGVGFGTLNLPTNSTITARNGTIGQSNGFIVGGSAGARQGDQNAPTSIVTTAAGAGTNTINTPLFALGLGKASSQFTVGADNTVQVQGVGGAGTRASMFVGNQTTGGGGGNNFNILDASAGTFRGTLSQLVIGGQADNTNNTSVNMTGVVKLGTSANNNLNLSGTGAISNGGGGTGGGTGVLVIGRTDAGSSGLTTGTLTIGNLDSASSVTNTANGTAILIAGTTGTAASGTGSRNTKGTLNLDGGTLTINTTGVGISGSTTAGANSNSNVNFNGTTLIAGASSSNFISNITNANVAAGGAKFDTNGKDITIAQALKHSEVGTVSLSVTNGGTGYGTSFTPANTPLVVLTQPGNPAAYGTATPVLNSAGAVVGLTNVNAQNFTGPATVTITNPSGGSGLAISSTFTPAATTDGGLTKSGAGSLTLTGANTYNGPTAVNGGLLNVNGSLTSNVSVASGASLGGTGTINGSLTFANNTELQVQTNGTFLTAKTVNAAGSVVTITPLGVIPGTPTTILNAPGGITGTIGTNFVLTSRGTLSEIGNTTLQLSTSGPGNLVWTGAQSSDWNIQQAQNWVNGATPDVFYNLDNVTFNDTAANRNVNLATNLTPGSVTIDHASGASYVFTGAAITGTTGLTKNGAGTAVIANANAYTGGTTINGGTLQLGDGVNGVGSLGTGAIVNNATLAVDYGANNGTLANAVSGTGGLAKNGSGTLSVSAANTYTGTTNINAGTVQLDGTGTLGTGDVVNNAALVANTTTTLANTISGSGTLATSGSANLTVTGTNSYTGGTTIATGTTINVGNGGTTGTLGSGPIVNSGTLAFNRSDAVTAPTLTGGTVSQVGAGTLTLGGANTPTTLNIGLNANNTGTVIVPAGASLSVGNAGTGNLIVAQTTGAAAAKGQLDASAADSFTANVANFGVGITGNSNGIATGTLNLPANSTITATNAVTIGESGGTRAGDTGVPVVTATTAAGGVTNVSTPTFQVANGKASSIFTLGSGNTLNLTGTGEEGRANFYVENMANGGGGGTYTGTADLSQGVINAKLSSLFVGNQSFTLNSTVNLTGTLTISNNPANHLDISGPSTANSRVLPSDVNSPLLNPGVVVVGRIDGVNNTGSVTGTLTIGNLDAASVITSTNNGTAIVVGGTNSGNAGGDYSTTGTLNLNGGTLKFVTTGAAIAGGTLPDPTVTPATAATRSTVNFNGMTLVAGASSTNWIHGIGDSVNGTSGAVVQSGGLIVDTNGFEVAVPQQFVSGGGTDGGLVKRGLGTLTVSAASSYTGATRIEKGALRATPTAYGTLLSNAAGVVLSGDGAKFVLDYTGDASPLAQVKTILANGYAGNFATGQIRGDAALPADRTLGYGDDGAGLVTVMKTIPGDANLNGVVDFNDFLVLQNNFNQPETTFAQGNFNFDGLTDFNDFLVLQNNFGAALPGQAAVVSAAEYSFVRSITASTAVPEPTALALIGLCGAGLMSRRRRTK